MGHTLLGKRAVITSARDVIHGFLSQLAMRFTLAPICSVFLNRSNGPYHTLPRLLIQQLAPAT
jgi:hypothetical protein